MMQGFSLFSSAEWTNAQVNQVLRTHFGAQDDDYWPADSPHKPAAGWMILVAPGRRVTIEDGTEHIAGFPDSVLGPQRVLLEGEPIRRLSISFGYGPVRVKTWAFDPGHGNPDFRSYVVEDPDLELRVVLWVGAALARHWPVSFDDLAGSSWRAWPWDQHAGSAQLGHAGSAPPSQTSATQPEPARPQRRRWWH